VFAVNCVVSVRLCAAFSTFCFDCIITFTIFVILPVISCKLVINAVIKSLYCWSVIKLRASRAASRAWCVWSFTSIAQI
jgi:hypothetical protein